jgi:hypothetical protein
MDIAEWLKNEDIQRNFRKASSAVVAAVYNEIYIYIWFICVYNIFLLIVVVINLYLLVRLWRGYFSNSEKTVYIGGLASIS